MKVKKFQRVFFVWIVVLWLLPAAGNSRDSRPTVQRLKGDLLSLLPQEVASERKTEEEADLLAMTIIQGFQEIRTEFRMLRPAWLHNLFIHLKLRQKGYCYHWTAAFYERLQELPLTHFTLHWASARRGGFREHNTLVITGEGGSIENGIVLDGWRKSGKPFWNFVGQDRYHWQEEPEALGLVF